jgi:hypothetical protein
MAGGTRGAPSKGCALSVSCCSAGFLSRGRDCGPRDHPATFRLTFRFLLAINGKSILAKVSTPMSYLTHPRDDRCRNSCSPARLATSQHLSIPQTIGNHTLARPLQTPCEVRAMSLHPKEIARRQYCPGHSPLFSYRTTRDAGIGDVHREYSFQPIPFRFMQKRTGLGGGGGGGGRNHAASADGDRSQTVLSCAFSFVFIQNDARRGDRGRPQRVLFSTYPFLFHAKTDGSRGRGEGGGRNHAASADGDRSRATTGQPILFVLLQKDTISRGEGGEREIVLRDPSDSPIAFIGVDRRFPAQSSLFPFPFSVFEWSLPRAKSRGISPARRSAGGSFEFRWLRCAIFPFPFSISTRRALRRGGWNRPLSPFPFSLFQFRPSALQHQTSNFELPRPPRRR